MIRLLSAGMLVFSAGLWLLGSSQAADQQKSAVATFAAGCFWCTESDFDKVDGVLTTVSGFMGGHVKNPTYKQVVRGSTGHTEVLQVTYDPSKVSYEKLLDVYWRNVDPFDKDGQFCDRGSQYRPEIFAHTPEQETLAKASKAAIISKHNFSQKIVVPVTKASAFTAADEYHQNFYKKNPFHYWRYRIGCRRDARLKQIWGEKPKS
ncbi:MAG: peptide-methionine (S)-S-oxide reductase MsrA [Pseudomonadota bacterium]